MWYEIEISSKFDIIEEATAAFYDLEIFELTIEDPLILKELSKDKKSWDYVDENMLNCENEKFIIKACVSNILIDKIIDDLENLLKIYLADRFKESFINIRYYEIDPDEYKDEWKKFFKPFYICENVMVCPSWEECTLKPNDKLIDIDPSGAFGTGNHETTSMCARFIKKYINPNDDVLDIGTGSGILSIVAKNLGANRVLAFDTDTNACEIARENISKNGFSNSISVINSTLKTNEKFDLVVANIIADVIMLIADDVKSNLKNNAIFITSGIITERREEVINKLMSFGYKVIDELSENGWTCICFRL